jgi:hypothetical protein
LQPWRFLHHHAKNERAANDISSTYKTALFIDRANRHSTAKTLGLIYFMGERRYPSAPNVTRR